MTWKLRKNDAPLVAIEIRRSGIHLAWCEPDAAENSSAIHVRVAPWQSSDVMLPSDEGRREIVAALKTIIAEEGLSGARAGFALPGDRCVTRVVTGSAERVRRELALMEQRSSLYLLLGPGPKSHATSIQAVDARHHHAMLAVTSAKALEGLNQIAAQAGLRTALVEPSLVALCRVLGVSGRDAEQPVLLVNMTDRGAELGISYHGQLLLDYRPGGLAGPAEVVPTVLRHLVRLRRYCDRYYRYAAGELTRVFLCGPPAEVAQIKEAFDRQDQLKAEILDSQRVDGADSGGTEACAALGTCLALLSPEKYSGGPNLARDVPSEMRRPLSSQLRLPLAAMFAVALIVGGLMGARWHAQSQCRALQTRVASLEPSLAELHHLRYQAATSDRLSAHLEDLAARVVNPPWHSILSAIAQCAPELVWAERLVVAPSRKLTIAGNSYNEAAIYQFARNLESYTNLSRVALEGTQTAISKQGAVIKFDLQCEITDCAGKGNGNGPR